MAKKYTNKDGWQVVKSNEFIQTTVDDLTKTQQKIVAFIFSTVHKDDKEFKEFNLSVSELLTLMGTTDAGKNYRNVKSALKTLYDKSWWVFKDKNPDEITLVRFFDEITINSKSNIITGKISNTLKPYLLDFQGKWTSYQLTDYLKLNSEYSMHLFEYLKSFEGQGWVLKPVDEIKEIMHATAPSYSEFKRFNDLILKKAIKEINEKTDIYVVCTAEKIPGGKKISHLRFGIKAQKLVEGRGPYNNVFLSDEEMHIIVDEWKCKDLLVKLSQDKYLYKKKGKKGDFATIKRWYKKRLEKRAEAEKARQEQSAQSAPVPSWLDDYYRENGIQQEKMDLFED